MDVAVHFRPIHRHAVLESFVRKSAGKDQWPDRSKPKITLQSASNLVLDIQTGRVI
jgi:hypothetical protein